jgi:F-type H+-transporting ATPase subunit gamma
MANLKEIRTRISSVSSTRQITSAMKMVSAAKLRKAQDTVTGFKPYSEKLTHILADVSGSDAQIKYANKRDIKNVLIVVVSSNKGLCGAFNANVAKKAISLAENEYSQYKVSFATIGKKAGEYLEYNGYNVIAKYNEVFDNLTFDEVIPIAQGFMDSFVEEKFDRIDIVYNSFKNAATQIVMTEQYLPVNTDVDGNTKSQNDYIFEPNKEEILENIIPLALKTQVYKAVIDSFAAEHGARMTAMHKATDNAGELLDDLTLTYNKARQAAITNEILEIVGGAEALKG